MVVMVVMMVTPRKPPSELKRRPNGTGSLPVRSVRVSDEAWALRAQASAEQLSVGAYFVRLATRDAGRRR
jgi:hypothetical protein